MLLVEFFSGQEGNDLPSMSTPDGYRTEKDDNSIVKMSDLRTTRLSLDQINRLRMMNDVRKLEQEQRIGSISKQYKTAAEPEAPAM